MKTKRFTAILGLIGIQLLTQGLFAQKNFEVKAKIDDAPENAVVILIYTEAGKRLDTTRIHDGRFSVKGVVDQPVKTMLFVEYKKETEETKGKMKQLNFYIDPGTTTITGKSLETATVTGGPTQSDYRKLTAAWKSVGYREGAKEDLALTLKKNKASLEFIGGHPSSPVSEWAMEQLARPYYLAEHQKQVKQVFKKMDADWQASKDGIGIAKMIETAAVLGIGMPAIDFEAKDTSGHTVKLSDFRGKYVLVDFWASWCRPCRGENPNVVKNYKKYKDKNFTVLGVSLDDAKGEEKWKLAIRQDGLTWTQVSDLMGWKSKIAQAYRVRSIPINYLIDPNGKIVAVGLRGETLGATLEKLLNK